ncbi:hypothetical protein GXM_02634 [Nostoc sphaeroides CCNUC1]|uniref:Uncharacterized protein n=1 Tax=Nostoc sphaeroides CCNUC1 TaxID=2653204 RepID=A0A5P8VXQ2_9NOSO|nr:hypothetical protein GXM_02634 [Nostoc sphaeroides CCNUC1]
MAGQYLAGSKDAMNRVSTNGVIVALFFFIGIISLSTKVFTLI